MEKPLREMAKSAPVTARIAICENLILHPSLTVDRWPVTFIASKYNLRVCTSYERKLYAMLSKKVIAKFTLSNVIFFTPVFREMKIFHKKLVIGI